MTETLVSLGATTVAAYQLRTGDTTTEASAVTAALVEAETLLGEELRRQLPLEERTDRLRIFPDGRAYPPAWPIYTAPVYVIDGRALLSVTPDAGPFVGVGISSFRQWATVTWTGGYDDGTHSPLPITLADAIYDLAHARIDGTGVSVLGGAVSASVGDVSVNYGTSASGLDELLPGLEKRVGKYRNRFV